MSRSVEHEREVEVEQRYFDHAVECRERSRSNLGSAPDAGVHRGAAEGLRVFVEERLRQLRPPEEAAAFGRIDYDEDVIYVGYNAIWDEQADVLVANWQAPACIPFFAATYAEPLGLDRRRQFECDRNTVLDFDDVVYADLAEDVRRLEELGVDDALLTDLQRSRTGEMQDVVRTIQAAQFELIRADPDQLLVIQGGPGTGKTAVALHRLSWLLYNHRDRLNPENVVVIGPNTTFVRYISKVLPSLGDQNVREITLATLAPPVRLGRNESIELQYLKGEERMRHLLSRGLIDRIRLPDGELEVDLASRAPITINRDELGQSLERVSSMHYNAGRAAVRQHIRDQVRRRGVGDDEPGAARSIDLLVERAMPQLTGPAFLQELLGSEARLLRAAGEDFTALEVTRLHRKSAGRISDETWSEQDVPLLDFAQQLLDGQPRQTFDHIVVDEAQDLSPMQLRMLSSRSPKGHMTILGDIAQSTGVWAHDDWSEITEMLIDGMARFELGGATMTELELGYRVPRQVFEFAAQLLPIAAPGLTPPKVIRDGPADPDLRAVGTNEVAARAAAGAMGYSARGNLVGVIVPDGLWDAMTAALDAEDVAWCDARVDGVSGTINLLAPRDAKGLEFDAVVVVEPAMIAAEELHGERMLYVALTRTTKLLGVVYSLAYRPLGLDGIEPGLPEAHPASTDRVLAKQVPRVDRGSRESAGLGSRSARLITELAADLADEIAETFQPSLWAQVLAELQVRLDERRTDDSSGTLDEHKGFESEPH